MALICARKISIQKLFIQKFFYLIVKYQPEVSNEIPEQAVISPVSGYVYEKRLLLKYLNENGTDPMNNQALSPEQLIEVKSM